MIVYYLTPAQFALSNIALKRLKVARFNELNDPFELLAVDVADQDLRIGMAAKKTQIDEAQGLLCFSRTWRNPLLWSHYADKHRGVALGFEIPGTELTPVRYVKGLRKINVLASSTKQKTIDDLLERLKYTKFKGWTYEDELRLFFSLDNLSSQSGLYFAPFSTRMQLREIILGPRCDLPLVSVRSLADAHVPGVEVFGARIAYTEFAVIPKQTTAVKQEGLTKRSKLSRG
jgi:hypothetical protein